MSSFAHKGAALLALAVLGVTACGGGGGGSAEGVASTNGGAVAGTTGNVVSSENPGTGGATGSTGSTPSAPDVIDSTGNVAATTYRDTAQKIAQGEGILYRYGAPSTVSVASSVPAAIHTPYPNYSPYESQVTWEVGGPYRDDAGDFSSNQGQYAFVPDNATQHAGIGTLELLAQRNNTFSYAPQPTWTMAPEVALAPTGQNEYYSAGIPAAMGRCYGYVCSQSVIAFANGTIGVFGSNTTDPRTQIKLDANKVPTAVAVTNGGEFALITVWDTAALKGQVAVIALAGAELLHMDWPALYPGLPNMGAFDFMKLLGYVDLPGMNAPTEISATTNVGFEAYQRLYLPTGSNPASCQAEFVLYRDVSLSVENNRQTFAPGGCNAGAYAQGGVAVVVSKSESKAAFINLKPLFDYYKSMYFGARADFDRTVNLGQGANQWPFAFSAVPAQTPTLIKMVDLGGKRPTAVKAALAGEQRAWIATEDGTIQIYNLGNYAGNGQSASPADIALRGSMAVGKNPTSLAYVKHDGEGDLIVVSRGESKLQWVQFSGNGGSIRRTLQDSRLKDPVWAEDNDNHGTESFVVTIADYAGKRVSNYRYGAVTFESNPGTSCHAAPGCGTIGGAEFEYGGSYDVPGKVFQVTGANVP